MRLAAGAVALVLGLAVYALLVGALAARVLPVHWLLDTLVYAIAGVAWIPLAARLTRWMQQPRAPRHSQDQRRYGAGAHLK